MIALLPHAAALLLLLALVLPMVVFHDAYFTDWANHLYLVDRQGDAWRETGLPSAYMHSVETGVFYPLFMFYGGTLYAVSGALAAILGPWAAYVLTWTAALAMTYGGSWWLGRQAGLTAAAAHLPALVVVTSAYWLTNIYGRGAWTEFMAVSALPLVAAAGASLLTAPRARGRDWALLVVALVVLTGSHNLTVLWSAVVFGAAGLIALAAGWRPHPRRSARRLAWLGAAAACALAVNGWTLIPTIAWAGGTLVYNTASGVFIDTDFTGFLNAPEVVLSPWRWVPSTSTTPGLYVQAPVLALAWSLLAAPRLLRVRGWLRTTWCAAAGTLALLLTLVFVRQTWTVVPDALKAIQFQFRLHSYVALCVAAMVALALLALREHPRRTVLTAAAAVVVAAGAAQGAWQAWTADRYGDVAIPLSASPNVPRTWYAPGDYRLVTPAALPFAATPAEVGVEDAGDGSARLPVVPPGRYGTNIVYSPGLDIGDGARLAGRDGSGMAVVDVVSGGGSVGTRWTGPTLAGALLSVAGFIALIAALGGLAARGWRARGPLRSERTHSA